MPTQKPPLSDENDKPARFWSWDIKLLILVNVIFLITIGIGLVMVYKALRPSIETYTQNADLLK